jgi:hypothetical protein
MSETERDEKNGVDPRDIEKSKMLHVGLWSLYVHSHMKKPKHRLSVLHLRLSSFSLHVDNFAVLNFQELQRIASHV